MKHHHREIYERRRGERGGLPVFIALALVVLLFIILVVFLWAAGGGGSGSQPDDGTGSTGEGTGVVEGEDDGGTVAPVPGCIIFRNHPRVTPRFLEKVVQTAASLRTDPNFLMATMKIESDFDHTIRNQMGGSATGLIQIVDKSARALGLPNAAVLASMSAVQQMEYVRRYYVMSGGANGRMREVEDAYMVVFYPKAAGQPAGYVIARQTVACTAATRRTDAYCGNQPYDLNRDGVITKSEAGAKVRRVYNAEMRKCGGGR
jgi:hypothetical protein